MADQVVIAGSSDIAKQRNPWGVFGLSIITLGIYVFFWWYFVNKEMVKLGRTRGTTELGDSPGMSALALFPGALLIVPPLVSYYRGVQRMQAAARITGAEPANGWIALILFVLLGIAFPPYLQSCLNNVWEAQVEGTALGVAAAPAVPAASEPQEQAPAQSQPPGEEQR
jgi:hypothetical protein